MSLTASLRGKLVTAGAILIVVITALASLLFFSASRYEYHLERSTVANRVLSSFQAISDHAYRKLNAMGQIGTQGAVDDVDARVLNEKRLWAALSDTRRYLEEEDALDPQPNYAAKLDRLDRIERIVEAIIAVGGNIRDAAKNDQPEAVARELAKLRSAEIAGQFNRLIDEAIAEERAVVASTQEAATRLSGFINVSLPAALVVTLMVGLLATISISRSLTRSLTGLEAAADAYSSGDLAHRAFAFRDAEFVRLGDAFNRMAEELALRRAEAEKSQESLERLVAERTEELADTLEQLEMVDANRRRFLADISHELRTPLTLIQGEADMVLRGADKPVDDYKQAVVRVREQAIHTARLVNDLLLMARADEGNFRVERRPVPLDEVIEEVCVDFRNAALKHDLTLKRVGGEDKPIVLGDRNRLRQVFAILLDNAIRYSDEGEDVEIQLRTRGGNAEVQVSNRGVQLGERELARAFDRFYRSDNAARRPEGSGLGLPVAKAIVDAHGGEIALSTEDGRVVAQVQLLALDPVREVSA